MSRPKVRRGLAVLALGSFLFAYAGLPAAIASATSATTTSTTTKSTATTSTTPAKPKTPTSANWIGVAQTVVVSTAPTGKVSGKPFVFTQWSANGSSPATLKVPMSASGFRNLSGLGTAPITDGYAVWKLNLSGVTHQRSVAHFPTAKLPLQVSAAYELNGKKVKYAKDIVGKTGELKVTYVVKNVTTKPTKVTYTSVFGDKQTATVKAPVPIAAIVDVTVPANFTNLKGPGASASGNGNGTSSASWTLLLFNPLGGVKQSVTYQAHVTDAVVPSATVEAAVLPSGNVPPLPQISEPGAPAVPVVTLGANLQKIQLFLQGARAKLAAVASGALNAFKQVAVPAVQGVSNNAAKFAAQLPILSASAQAASINAQNHSIAEAQASAEAANAATGAANVQSGLSRASSEAANAASGIANVQGGLRQASSEAANAVTGMANVRDGLRQASSEAVNAASGAADVRSGLQQAVAEAADAAARVGEIRTGLQALPEVVKLTPAWRELYRKVVRLELRLTAHAAGLRVTAGKAGDLGVRLVAHAARLRATAARAGVEGFRLVAHAARLRVTADRAGLERVRLDAHAVRLRLTAAKAGLLSLILTKLSGLLIKTSADAANILAPAAHTVSTKLLTLVAPVKTLSAKAAEVATTLSNATLSPHKPGKLIGTKQIGGGAKLDAAVGKLDAAISETAAKVDNAYAYLTALNKRAAENKLPAGDAKGATAQVGAFVYSVSGANNTAHQTHLAIFIGGFLLVIGLGFGIALYRIRRGLPSSMAPPKSSGAAA